MSAVPTRRRPWGDGLRLRLALLRMSAHESPAALTLVVALLALALASPLVFARSLATAVDSVNDPERLMSALVVVGCVFAVQQATSPLLDAVSDVIGLRVRGAVFRRTVVALLRPASITHVEEPETADVVSRATAPNQYGPRSAVRGLLGQTATRASGIGSLLVIAAYRWWAAAIVTAAIVQLGLRTRHRIMDIATAQHFQTRQFRRSDYLRELLVTPVAAKEIRVFGLNAWFVGRFAEEWRRAMAVVWQRRRGILTGEFAGLLPLAAAVAMVAWLTARDAVTGDISVGAAAAVFPALLAAPTLVVVGAWDNWLELGLGSIDALLELESTMDQRAGDMAGHRTARDLPKQTIRFEAVSFRYSNQDRDVLRDLDLTINVGTSLAVVGENGAGKTTLVKLLTRLYDPTAGRVTVDGIDLRDVDPRQWQSRSAAIFQDFTKLPISVSENVAFLSSTEVDAETLGRAAVASGVEAIVSKLPDRWDTVLSRRFGGTDLSGGEWQRVALARALYAAERGAPILILDEPTSQLDVRQEAAFYDRFLDVTAGRTAIVISHRFSTVRRADRIVVLEDGRIAEDGTHDELVKQGGRYAAMYRAQAMRYEPESADG